MQGIYNATEMAQSLTRTGRLSQQDSVLVEECHASDGMLDAWGLLWEKLDAHYQARVESFVRIAMADGGVTDIPKSFQNWRSISPYHQLLFAIGLSFYAS